MPVTPTLAQRLTVLAAVALLAAVSAMAIVAQRGTNEGAAALTSARDLQPQHGRTRFQLALALYAQGKREEARAEMEQLSAIDPVLAGELRVILGA